MFIMFIRIIRELQWVSTCFNPSPAPQRSAGTAPWKAPKLLAGASPMLV